MMKTSIIHNARFHVYCMYLLKRALQGSCTVISSIAGESLTIDFQKLMLD
jgi:hypothetical protein